MPLAAPFAEVILPLAVKGTFTYSVPGEMSGRIGPGCRVLVSFGKKRLYTAVVRSLGNHPPEGFSPKPLLELLDEAPSVTAGQLQLWDWMASYYLCTLGEVMRAALPSGLRPESESRVRVHAGYEDDGSLDPPERLLYEVLKDEGEVTIGDLRMTGITDSPLRVLKNLVERGAVEIDQFVRRQVRRKSVTYVQLPATVKQEGDLHRWLDTLSRAPRQKGLLERFLHLAQSGREGFTVPVEKTRLVENPGDGAALSTLVRKGVLETASREELPQETVEDPGPPFTLTGGQQRAYEEIRKGFLEYQTVLLRGVTSSGKTEIYIHLIARQLKEGKQVLYLLPEIALTSQIIGRIRRVFGSRVGVYHSRASDSERVHVYRNLLGLTDEEPYGIVIGVRSAIFLPFRSLGLVIIDEEHEHTFKQQDPAPRYHARDSAQMIAMYHSARVLMGTSTPSFESLYNARKGKFGYVELTARYGNVAPPEIILADLTQAQKRKQMVSYLTPALFNAIGEALKLGEQVILFQNRRGYSPYLLCLDCGAIPRCSRCDVSLTYHRISQRLECHYCGAWEPIPAGCVRCGGSSLSMKGFGTEKIEEEIPLIFEGVQVGRLDTDTARTSDRVLRDFSAGKIQVLVGTQMISKGLDFDRLTVVGILDADNMLHFPDFRAFERTYQLVHQVGGRAGRRKKQGTVVVQTRDSAHPVIQAILDGDYDALYRDQMEERQIFGYPPFRRMIRITFRHKVPSILDGAAAQAATQLKEIFSERLLGPQYPPVRKVQGLFIKHLVLKIEREASYGKAKELLEEVLDRIRENEVYRSVRQAVDVDPH